MKAFSHDCGEGDVTVYICPNSSHCTLNISKLPGNYVPKCVPKTARMIFRHRVAQGFPMDLPQACSNGATFSLSSKLQSPSLRMSCVSASFSSCLARYLPAGLAQRLFYFTNFPGYPISLYFLLIYSKSPMPPFSLISVLFFPESQWSKAHSHLLCNDLHTLEEKHLITLHACTQRWIQPMFVLFHIPPYFSPRKVFWASGGEWAAGKGTDFQAPRS